MTVPAEVVKLDEKSVSWKLVDGRVIALNLRTSTYLTTNASGSYLWPHLVEGATVSRLAELLAAAFGIDHEVSTADVQRFVGTLRSAQMLDGTE